MTDDAKHEAEGPEEGITSEGLDELADHAAGAPPTAQAPADDVPAGGEPEKTQDELAKPGTETPKLERLQKILAQAGIASRRHAEELITQGRVQVNGQVVTTLGSKADPGRDHIRVDGKLLHGAERHRYFLLNKPRGYVTTVSDPEGRPTVMRFFAKMRERLYPVGRLDYQSEGLLLVTNDGELANRLTKAASDVEKTYLVKVAGKPSEEALDRVRQGILIDRSKPGQGRVNTAPVRVRPISFGRNAGYPRSGLSARGSDNPWYEVVLIEGRNRELRKIFEEVGHHVEKIRRIGYGPLKLDIEPGKFRELQPGEVAQLRLASEGKLRHFRLDKGTMPRQDAGKKDVPDQRRSGDRRRRTSPPALNRDALGPRPKSFRPAGDRQEPVAREAGRRNQARGFAGRRREFHNPRGDRPTLRSGKSESGGAKPLKGDRFGSKRAGAGSSKPEGKLRHLRLDKSAIPRQDAGKEDVREQRHSGDRPRRTSPPALKRDALGPGPKSFRPPGDRQEPVAREAGRRNQAGGFAGRRREFHNPRGDRPTLRSGKSESGGAKPLKGDGFGTKRAGAGPSKPGWRNRPQQKTGRPNAGPHPGRVRRAGSSKRRNRG